MSRDAGTGDGDFCPINPAHGRMMHLKGVSGDQYCSHTDHDGKPKGAPDGPTPATRCFWPTGADSFPKAVAVYTNKEVPANA